MVPCPSVPCPLLYRTVQWSYSVLSGGCPGDGGDVSRISVRFTPPQKPQRGRTPILDQQFSLERHRASHGFLRYALPHARHSPGCRSPPNDRLMTAIGSADSSRCSGAAAHAPACMCAHAEVHVSCNMHHLSLPRHGLPWLHAACTRPPGPRGSSISCLKPQ